MKENDKNKLKAKVRHAIAGADAAEGRAVEAIRVATLIRYRSKEVPMGHGYKDGWVYTPAGMREGLNRAMNA
jgi:hypothetical protein